MDRYQVLLSDSAGWWIDALGFMDYLAYIELREALRQDPTPNNPDVQDLGEDAFGLQHRGVLGVYEFIDPSTILVLHVMRTFGP
jgi:hypothetical protein